jgi:hypothetical protein
MAARIRRIAVDRFDLTWRGDRWMLGLVCILSVLAIGAAYMWKLG